MSVNESIQQSQKGDSGSKAPPTSPGAHQPNLTEIFVLEAEDDEGLPVQLEKSFTSMAAFGFCFAVLNSWVVLLAGLGAGLSSGGPTACKYLLRYKEGVIHRLTFPHSYLTHIVIWGFLYAIICNLALTLSLSEPFSVYPTAGGQYHWAAILSSPRYALGGLSCDEVYLIIVCKLSDIRP